ncbi:MAG TPA: hypothetical protein VMN57_16995 [Anaerolineales bacterium]|nr:hypothetical protein [Anaerolineales bacterium]
MLGTRPAFRPSLRVCAAVLLCLAGAAGCTPEEPPPAPILEPTTAVLTVHLAGELGLLRPVLAACTAEIPGIGLLVFETPAPELPEGPDEMTLWLGEPPDDAPQAALLGTETIVVAAHASLGRDAFTEAEVRALFTEGGGPAFEVWVPQAGQVAREVLDAWLEGGGYPPEAFLSPTPEAAVAAVAADPGAVAVIPSAWLTADLSPVFSLGELPVLALTDRVPEGRMRGLIGCLQLNPVYRK